MEAARGAGRFTIMNDDKRAEEMRWALNNVQDSTGAGTFGSESSAGLRMIATVKAQ
jgi:hypothetical protein